MAWECKKCEKKFNEPVDVIVDVGVQGIPEYNSKACPNCASLVIVPNKKDKKDFNSLENWLESEKG